jgi:hypothetical protein
MSSDVPAPRVRACKQEELNMAVRVFGHTHFWVGMRRMSAGIIYAYSPACPLPWSPTYMHTYIPSYVHTNIPTYIYVAYFLVYTCA